MSALDLADAVIRDLELAIAIVGRLYPARAESMSLNLRDYRAALALAGAA